MNYFCNKILTFVSVFVNLSGFIFFSKSILEKEMEKLRSFYG